MDSAVVSPIGERSVVSPPRTRGSVPSVLEVSTHHAQQQIVQYPKGTRVVEISGGRQFVSRPLDPSYMNNSIGSTNQQQHHPQHHNQRHYTGWTGQRYSSQGFNIGRSAQSQESQETRPTTYQHPSTDLARIFPQQLPPCKSNLYPLPETLQPWGSAVGNLHSMKLSSPPVGKTINVHEILGVRGSPLDNAPLSTIAARNRVQTTHPQTPATASITSTQPLPKPLQVLFPFTTAASSSARKSGSTEYARTTTPFMKLLQTSVPSESRKVGTTSGTSDVVGLLAAAAAIANTKNMTSAKRRHSCDALKSPKGGIQWLFDAAASMTQSTPPYWESTKSDGQLSPVVPPNNIVAQQQYEDSWEFVRPEDLIDDELLFRREELQRRKHPRYLAKTKRLHDLHIVMPICVPHGKIVVDDPLGANFYTFRGEKRGGAEILFGKGIGDVPKQVELEQGEEDQENEKPHETPQSTLGISPVCDVWASFLNVRLGTIYNLTASHMPIVADLFKRSFDHDLCKFYVPIAMDCRGVHPSSDDLISQRAGRPMQLMKESKNGKKIAAERYETHAVPTSENDIKRLRMLRRHLRKFALRLINDLGFDSGPLMKECSGDHLMNVATRLANEQPRPCIELHDNLRSDTLLRGSLKIVVREWSPLSDPEVFKRVWAGQLASPGESSGIAAEVRTKLLEHKTIPSARVLSGEIRLEHNHLRMVDPRWPEELVPGRRVADQCPENEAPGPEVSQARFVFCSRVPKPQIIYKYAEAAGSDPRDACLNSRLSALFKVHLARHPTAGTKSCSRLCSTAPSASRSPEKRSPEETGASTPIVCAIEEATEANGDQELEYPRGEKTTLPNGAVDENAKKEPISLDSPQQHGAIRSLSDLKILPEPFVPVLPESRKPRHLVNKCEMPGLLQQMLQHATEAEKITSDQSALKVNGTFEVPLTTVACKFFLKGGCARGSGCYFFHPADPRLESKVDVRHIVPKHPKFF